MTKAITAATRTPSAEAPGTEMKLRTGSPNEGGAPYGATRPAWSAPPLACRLSPRPGLAGVETDLPCAPPPGVAPAAGLAGTGAAAWIGPGELDAAAVVLQTTGSSRLGPTLTTIWTFQNVSSSLK